MGEMAWSVVPRQIIHLSLCTMHALSTAFVGERAVYQACSMLSVLQRCQDL